MGKPFAVCALCVISAALGAAIDRYLAGAIEQGGPHLERAVSPKAAVAAPAEMNVEVLGDRVRCDVRYQELKGGRVVGISGRDRAVGGAGQCVHAVAGDATVERDTDAHTIYQKIILIRWLTSSLAMLAAMRRASSRVSSERQNSVRLSSFCALQFTLACLVENWGLAWGSHLRCALYASFLRLWGQQLTAILPERLSRAVLTWNEQ